MPTRRPQDPKRSGAIGVVVEHSDEQTFTKLPAYGEVGQVGDAQALLGQMDQRLKRACDRRFRKFNLDAGLLGRHGPLLEPSAGRKLAEESGSLDVRRMAARTAIWTQPNLKTAQSERPRRMSKIVEGVFVPRLNSLNEWLRNDRFWRIVLKNSDAKRALRSSLSPQA